MTDAPARAILPGSFRDPGGFLFTEGGVLYRQVNLSSKEPYERLMRSGLYRKLVEEGALIPHEEVSAGAAPEPPAYRILRPEPVPFVSYPYEWCFSQLREAALLTLKIQRAALGFGLSLKDASAYNVQFRDGRPLLIDTLSFDLLREDEPWAAYRQFCQQFLAPLALMSRRDAGLSRLSALHLDGIPLELASRLLPGSSRLQPGLLVHLHLHAGAQRLLADRPVRRGSGRMSRPALLGLTDSLEAAVRSLRWRPRRSAWEHYDTDPPSYDRSALEQKQAAVAQMLERIRPAPRTAWDLGANTGLFSRLAARRGIFTVALDQDPACVELNFRRCLRDGETNLLPLVMDLANPSPALGWEHRERLSLLERGPADAALALALIHHLAIGNDLPLERIVEFLGRICRWGIVEFVPKSDPLARPLLALRTEGFPDYTPERFEEHVRRGFSIRQTAAIPGTQRTLYLLERNR